MELVDESADYWVDIKDVIIGPKIGAGEFSTVYVGRYFGDFVAVKKQLRGSKGLELYLQRELTILKNLRKSDQQFLVTYIGAYNDYKEEGRAPPYALYIITEYCQGGDLLNLLINQERNPSLGWKFRLRLALQAASAVHYLHEINFIHRDIKSENFLLDSNWNCKLTDFGLSREIADPSVPSRMTICGTKEYTAPEMHFEDEYTSGIDIYSLGMVFIETIIRRKVGINDFISWRPQNKFVLPEEDWENVPSDAPPSFVLLAQQCVSYEFYDRPMSGAVLDWIQDLSVEFDIPDECPVPIMPAAPSFSSEVCAPPPSPLTSTGTRANEILSNSPDASVPAIETMHSISKLSTMFDVVSNSKEDYSKSSPLRVSISNIGADSISAATPSPGSAQKKSRRLLMSEVKSLQAEAFSHIAQSQDDLKGKVLSPGEKTLLGNVVASSSSEAIDVKVGATSKPSSEDNASATEDSNFNLTQAEANRLSARNSALLTPQMIRYLHTRSSFTGSIQAPLSPSSSGSSSAPVVPGKQPPSEEIVPVRVGYLSKRNTYGFRNWKKYLFVLTKNSLAYHNTESSAGSSTNLVYILLRGASIHVTRENRFQILNTTDQSDLSAFYNRELAAESNQSMLAWIRDINSAIANANAEAEAALQLLNDEAVVADVAADDNVPMEIKRRASLLNFNLSNVSTSTGSTDKQLSKYSSIRDWLSALNMVQYEELFTNNGYSFEMVSALGLREVDLQYLGIENPLHRIVLQSCTKSFPEYVHVAITGARQFDSLTVFVVNASYKFSRSSLCLRYTDFKKFDTMLRNEIKKAGSAVVMPSLPGQGASFLRGSRDPVFVANRQRALEEYLISLSSVLYGTNHLAPLLVFLELN